MIHENEIIMLLLGASIFLFIMRNHVWFSQIKAWKVIRTAYTILLLGWLFTVLEEYIFNNIFNWAEHICYALSSIILVMWFLRVIKTKKKVD